MKAKVFSVEGKEVREIDLPKAFDSPLNTELIKRAVLSIQSKKKQPKGTDPRAGRNNTAVARSSRVLPQSERTINVGHARIPRLKNRKHLLYGRVARVPQSVGGIRAHPPKAEKIIAEEINKKEKRSALLSAVGASTSKDLVGKRHVLEEGINLPLIIENKFEEIAKTKDVVAAFKAINVFSDLENAKSKCRPRSGRGKTRGRKKKQKISLLIVTKNNSKVYKAARNIPGIDVSPVDSLNVELLAPGCMPGRLVVWTEDAAKAVGERA
jgi:large subunit ribosomal protein L4e